MSGRKIADNVSVSDRSNLEWRKSSFSDDQGYNCVEVALADGQILVRNSKHPDGPTLAFTRSEWRAFVSGVKASEFDLP